MRLTAIFTRWLPLVAVLSAGPFVAGCNTYHYYDIDVKAMSPPVTEIQTSGMDFCQVLVTGADSHTITWTPDNGCPPTTVFPDMGSFEFATFADSGMLTFTFNGYSMALDPSMLCTTASKTFDASDTITNPGTIMVTQFNETNCPPHVTTSAP